MAIGEFALIDRFFSHQAADRDDVTVGIGDDGAVLAIDEHRLLVTTLCTAAEAAWKRTGGDAARLGNDVMAAALNRLAAAGAQPAFATLALTLPEADERWLGAFSHALLAVAEHARVELVGGDTTRGPFAATVVGHGLIERRIAETRARVRLGDNVYVSGVLGADGDARPLPSTLAVGLGVWLRAHGGLAEDLSEGLAAALAALLCDPALGATCELARLPLAGPTPRSTRDWSALVRHHGDMQLCITLDAGAHDAIVRVAETLGTRVTRIAQVDDSGQCRLLAADGSVLPGVPRGDETRAGDT